MTLQGSGKYVTFITPVATNSIDFRYSIPDSSDGSVYTSPLSLYINGAKQTDFTLTNAYSWYYGSYPFTNTPGSDPHHFYDESRRLFSTTYPAGTVWIPPGSYNIPGHISVNNVTITGAGMWYYTITGTAPGFYGNSAPSPSTNVHLQNFAIFGNVQERCDSCQVNGIGGAMSGLTLSGMRIRDTTADGLTTISNNTMIRDGQLDPNWQFGIGVLWFDGSQGWGGGPVNVTIVGTGTFALQEQTPGTVSRSPMAAATPA